MLDIQNIFKILNYNKFISFLTLQMEKNPLLEHVLLYEVSSETFSHFSEASLQLKRLKGFHIRNLETTSDLFESSISKIFHSRNTIEVLSIQSCPQFNNVSVKKCTGLHAITLMNTSVTEKGLISLMEINPRLESIEIDTCTNKVLFVMANICKDLSQLSLPYCFDIPGSKGIAEVIKSCKQLKTLACPCHFTINQVKETLKSLCNYNKNLEFFFYHTDETDEDNGVAKEFGLTGDENFEIYLGFKDFSQKFKKTLTSFILSIGKSREPSNRVFISNFLQEFTVLKVLELKGDFFMTWQVLENILKSNSNLESLHLDTLTIITLKHCEVVLDFGRQLKFIEIVDHKKEIAPDCIR